MGPVTLSRLKPAELLKRGAFVIAFALCLILLCMNVQLLGGPSAGRVNQNEVITDGWVTPAGDPVNLIDLAATPGWTDEGITIQRRLPGYIESGSEFNFLSVNCTLKLYYDDELAYTFEPDPDKYGKAFAPHFNFAPLSVNDTNKLAIIEITPAHTDTAVTLLDIRISGTFPYIRNYVRAHALDFFMSFIVVFIGLVVIIMHYSLTRFATTELDLLSLGAVCVLLGIWSSAETLVLQLVTGMGLQIRALEHLAILFLPYPVCCFMGSLIRPRHRKSYERFFLVVSVISIIATMGLGVFFNMDLHATRFISRFQLLLLLVTLVIQVVASIREHGPNLFRGLQESSRVILVASFILIVATIIDFTTYRISFTGSTDSATFMRFCLFAFALIFAVEAFKMSIEFMERADHFSDIEAVAYIDALTGIGNRTAWVLMKNEMDEAIKEGAVTDAVVCTFDVNFLKRVNDTYGHNAGDEHLKRAAETINRSFGTEGACYRTGGDEFTSLLVGINLAERLTICRDLLAQSIEEQNEMGEGKEILSMAMGFAYVSESIKHTIDSANTLADKRMYENKRSMKAERTD